MILPATEQDLPAILELTHRAYAAPADRGIRYQGATESLESLVQAWRENPVYKLVSDGTPVGTVRLSPHADHLLVWRLCVDPPCQRRGHGSALLRFAEAEAARLRLPRVRLDTADLADWYRRRGYEPVSEGRDPEVNVPLLLLEKRVSGVR